MRRYGVEACEWTYENGHNVRSLYYMFMTTRKHLPQKRLNIQVDKIDQTDDINLRLSSDLPAQ